MTVELRWPLSLQISAPPGCLSTRHSQKALNQGMVTATGEQRNRLKHSFWPCCHTITLEALHQKEVAIWGMIHALHIDWNEHGGVVVGRLLFASFIWRQLKSGQLARNAASVFVWDNGDWGGLGVLLDVQRSESRPPLLENMPYPFHRGGQGWAECDEGRNRSAQATVE